jgi:hypothetical protein
MSTIGEIEKAVPHLSVKELEQLEEFIRKARRQKERVGNSTLREIEPVSVRKVLQPLGTRDQWYEEMRENGA